MYMHMYMYTPFINLALCWGMCGCFCLGMCMVCAAMCAACAPHVRFNLVLIPTRWRGCLVCAPCAWHVRPFCTCLCVGFVPCVSVQASLGLEKHLHMPSAAMSCDVPAPPKAAPWTYEYCFRRWRHGQQLIVHRSLRSNSVVVKPDRLGIAVKWRHGQQLIVRQSLRSNSVVVNKEVGQYV